MRPALLLAIAICAAAGEATEIPADKSAFHIFVLMGQSNMAGTSIPVPVEYVDPSPDVLVLRKDLVWRQASTPLDPAHGGGFSLGQSFARHYAALHPGVKVGLIQCARGGRGIKELAKGGKDRDGSPNYDDGLARIRAAMERGTLKGMLWHQGETDAGDAGYVARLAALVADLRADTGIADLPVVVGQLGQYATWTKAFNGRITAAATEIPRCGIAMSDGLLDLGDKVHFSGFGSEAFGARYLEQYLQLAEPALVEAWKPRAAGIAEAMAKREQAWTAVLNGDMSEGAGRPFAWDSRWTGKGGFTVARDTTQSASPPASLCIVSNPGGVKGSVSQSLREVSGRRLRITARIRNQGFTAAQVLMTAIDKGYKPCFNTVVITTGPTTGWQAFSAEVAVPAEAMRANLALGVDGEGSAWFDDIAVERLP
jgi:hypothetical protein